MRKQIFRNLTRSDTNRVVQIQKIAREETGNLGFRKQRNSIRYLVKTKVPHG